MGSRGDTRIPVGTPGARGEPGPPLTLPAVKLTERDRRTLRSLAAALLPDGGPLPGAEAVDVAGALRRSIEGLPRGQAGRLVALVRTFSAMPLASGGRRFRNLAPAARERALARLAASHGYRGQVFGALKQLVVTTWASQPAVTEALGAGSSCLADSDDRAELVGRWLPEEA